MKKLFALLLAMMLVMNLTACGGDSSSEQTAAETEAAEEAVSEGEPTEEQLKAVTEAYNQVAILYNDVAVAANENGWMSDEQTAADIKDIGSVLEPVGTALTGDLSALEGADFDSLPDVLMEFAPVLEELAAKVAEPYAAEEGAEEGTTVITDEKLIPLANAVNQVIVVYNDVYALAEENGWLADEQTAAELQAVMGTLTFAQSGLTDDPSKLENVQDFDELANQILSLEGALNEVAERVSVPYEN